jgi:hypothetical protein
VQIHWLASYPKSGNTWVRFLLYHYFYGELTETLQLGRRIPDVHAGELPRAASNTRTLLVKCHWTLTPTMPCLDRTAGAVYIVRHPKDVVLSLLAFYRLRDPEAVWTDEEFVRSFIRGLGDPSSKQKGFGTWAEHVTSWTGPQRFTVLLVRYEDLKSNAALQLRRIVEFLGESADDARLKAAADACTFQRMRSLEAREKLAGKQGMFDGGKAELTRGLMFMNKGRSNQTLARIGPTLDREFDERFRAPMKLMGYGPEGRADRT